MATAPTKLWTVDDLDDLPDGRTEIWRGELVEMPAAGGMHSSLAIAVAASIYNFARASERGVVFGADGGAVLPGFRLPLAEIFR